MEFRYWQPGGVTGGVKAKSSIDAARKILGNDAQYVGGSDPMRYIGEAGELKLWKDERDANPAKPPHKSLNAILNAIRDASTPNELRRVYLGAVSEYADDATTIWKVQDATANRKAELARLSTLGAKHAANPGSAPTSKSKFIATRSKAKALRDAQALGINAPIAVKAPGGYVVYSAYAKNPAAKKSTRIARKGVSKKRYVSRPSQITGTTPTKRLRKRRETMDILARDGVTGAFPNPIRKQPVMVQMWDATGDTIGKPIWLIIRRFADTPRGIAQAKKYARQFASDGFKMRVVRED